MTKRFRARAGSYPAVFGGRKYQIELFEASLEMLTGGEPAESDFVLVGPRGNGKTTLLEHLRRMCEQHPPDFRFARLVGGHLASPETFANALLAAIPRPSMRHGARLRFKLETLDGALVESDPPLVLCIDEAYAADPKTLGHVLNASQLVNRPDVPFMLVLALTPEIEDVLRGADASFWDKGRFVNVGKLKRSEAIGVLQGTMRKLGLDLDGKHLTEAIEPTHNYPFFVQVMGEELRSACKTTGTVAVGERELVLGLERFELRKKPVLRDSVQRTRRRRCARPGDHFGACVRG